MRIAYIAQANETGAKVQADVLGDALEGVTYVSASTLDIPMDEPYIEQDNVIYPATDPAEAIRALDPDVVLFHVLNGVIQEAFPEIAAEFPTILRAGLNHLESWIGGTQMNRMNIGGSIQLTQQFDHLIAPSPGAAKGLRAIGIGSDRITHIPSTIDFSDATDPRMNTPTAVGCLAGRVSPLKNQLIVALAMGALREIDHTIAAPLYLPGGNQANSDAIKAAANAMGLGDWIQTGMYYDDPEEEFWPKIGVHVQPSFSEQMPLTVLEAARAGVPTIAADMAWVEQFPGVPTVDADDPWAWAEQLAKYLTNDAERMRMAQFQQESFEELYDIGVVAPQYVECFERVIDDVGRFKVSLGSAR